MPEGRTNRAKFLFVDSALMIFSDPTLTVGGKGIAMRKLENNRISPKIPDLMKFAWGSVLLMSHVLTGRASKNE